jgi:hypothetical protein
MVQRAYYSSLEGHLFWRPESAGFPLEKGLPIQQQIMVYGLSWSVEQSFLLEKKYCAQHIPQK